MFKILLVSVLMMIGSGSMEPRKTLLTVYYESKCPDSKRFITEQLLPTVQQLQEYLTVQMVPFGKASSVNNGYIRFKCQHGPSECRGNLMQSCALSLMTESPDIEKVIYVACEMNTLFGTNGLMQCAENSHIPLAPLRQCVSSNKGVDLQLEAEYLTKQLKPKFIPTITVDGEFDQEIQDRSQYDLMGTLCEILTDVPQCDKDYQPQTVVYM